MPAVKADAEMVIPKKTDGCWRWSRERYLEEKKKGNIAFKESKGVLIDSEGNPAKWNIYTKIWLDDRQEDGMVPVDLITKWENRHGTKELTDLKIPFDFAKPSELIKYLISIVDSNKAATILDFFSGSATTAHAVMKFNSEDGGNRKFIMVQLPEETDEKSDARKAGFKTICEIGKERVRRAGMKIKDDSPLTTANLDVGFRVLKCDTSNMKEVFYRPDEVEQTIFDNYANNIKEDRTSEDLLFQVMLDLGVLLSSKIEETTIADCKVFNVADGFLYACFDNNISDEVVKAIANEQPYYAVFRDSGMASDSVLTNFDQIFASISPTTVRKVL